MGGARGGGDGRSSGGSAQQRRWAEREEREEEEEEGEEREEEALNQKFRRTVVRKGWLPFVPSGPIPAGVRAAIADPFRGAV